MLLLQTCIYHTMTLEVVSSPICCMPCSSWVTSALEETSWIGQVDPMDLKDDESAVDLEVWVENCLDYLLLLSAVVGCPLVMDCCFLDLLLLLLLVEVVLLLPDPIPPPEPAPPPPAPPYGPPVLP